MLNTDCLWVFDEIQLMGAGLATTTQLEAFRRLLPEKETEAAQNCHGCCSVWMSATMRRDWLKTVDFAPFLDGAPDLTFDFEKEIKGGGLAEKARKTLENRWNAKKPLNKAEAAIGDAAGLAREVRNAHKPGTRTIVIVNTVKRACALFEALKTTAEDHTVTSDPAIVLLHSRFRPEERKRQVDRAVAEIKPGEPGTIVVSTQVVEAGVDVSATILFTELAPWASLVQRFGRCNRKGENDGSQVFWIDVPDDQAAPYDAKDLDEAREQLQGITKKPEEDQDVGLRSLPIAPLKFDHTHVIRRKDLIDLFDTTPDLAGNDIDIDRFVRDVEDSDARVFWRSWEQPKGYEPPREDEPAPQREEICPAPIGSDKNPGFRQFAKTHAGKVWRWNFLDNKWERANPVQIAPGQVFLVHADAGGYSAERGWDSLSNSRVYPIVPLEGTKRGAPDSTEGEPLSRIGVWQTVAEHVNEVREDLDEILKLLHLTSDEAEALRHAVRWHDRGKAHEIFQRAVPDDVSDTNKLWAKAPNKGWKRYERRHFRHELASALSVLDPRNEKIPDELRDLVAYLVAAHHGKVRLSIRSLPNEFRPDGDRRFARGVWDDDELPATELGGGVTAPAVTLSMEPMELGLCEREPFRGLPSWAERMIRLRDTIGPFRLAYIEAILRAADMRASRAAEQREANKLNLEVADGRREAVRD